MIDDDREIGDWRLEIGDWKLVTRHPVTLSPYHPITNYG